MRAYCLRTPLDGASRNRINYGKVRYLVASLQAETIGEVNGSTEKNVAGSPKAPYIDALPVSNADVGATAARILGLTQMPKGKLAGRVMTEAMPNGATPRAFFESIRSQPSATGMRTVLKFQRVEAQRYFDAAGFPGRTLGLEVSRER